MNAGRRFAFILALAFSFLPRSLSAQNVQALAQDFWKWRAQEQPFSSDDIPRIERPADFVVDWSPRTVASRKLQLAAYERRWKELALPPTAPFPNRSTIASSAPPSLVSAGS